MAGSAEKSLLQPYLLGDLRLPNRVAMASMTRGRTRNKGLIPTELQAEYYAQRADAGLIITEGTWINQQAIGFINVPGIFSREQVEGWKVVTSAVHARGGRIFCQLAHSGAVSHPDFYDGELPVGPSAINPQLKSFTPSGLKDTVAPRAMTRAEIHQTVADFAGAAANAKSAGFDGVELHAATTYLLPEFLNSALNVRTDEYGGGVENRSRLVLEILEELSRIWGAGRVGIKLSPAVTNVGGFMATDETGPTYEFLIDRLNLLNIAYLHLVNAQIDLVGTPIEGFQNTVKYFRPRYNGVLIANGGYDWISANTSIQGGDADLISFARHYIGNPDLVMRFEKGIPLAESNRETYYQGGAEGFTDYNVAQTVST